jgi:hypothetical protein
VLHLRVIDLPLPELTRGGKVVTATNTHVNLHCPLITAVLWVFCIRRPA